MKITHLNAEKLTADINRIVTEQLPKEFKVFYFGSRVRGNNFARSDIDIGIMGPQTLSADKFLNLKQTLEELPTLYTFDLVDLRTVSDQFRTEALRYSEAIN